MLMLICAFPNTAALLGAPSLGGVTVHGATMFTGCIACDILKSLWLSSLMQQSCRVMQYLHKLADTNRHNKQPSQTVIAQYIVQPAVKFADCHQLCCIYVHWRCHVLHLHQTFSLLHAYSSIQDIPHHEQNGCHRLAVLNAMWCAASCNWSLDQHGQKSWVEMQAGTAILHTTESIQRHQSQMFKQLWTILFDTLNQDLCQ